MTGFSAIATEGVASPETPTDKGIGTFGQYVGAGSGIGTFGRYVGTGSPPPSKGAGVFGATTDTTSAWAGQFVGDVTVSGTVFAGAIMTPSDRTLKTGIVPLKNSLAKLSTIGTYQYKFDQKSVVEISTPQVGVMADEVAKVFSGSCLGNWLIKS